MNKIAKNVMLLAIAAMLLTGTACVNQISEVTTKEQETGSRSVSIETRTTSSDATINYPLIVYAFSTSGKLVKTDTIKVANETLEMTLAVASYKLVAIAGAKNLSLPENPTLTDDIGIPESGLMDTALQIGRADITVGDADVTANIALSHPVTQVDLELQDIPEDVTAVSVTLSPLYTGLTFGGESIESESNSVTIPLSKEAKGNTWKSTTCYVLPGVANNELTLSINLTNASSTKTYGYTHTSTLLKNKPYELIGSYKAGFNVSGNLTINGWETGETINFKFGPGAETSEDESEENNNENSGNESTGNSTVNSDGTYTVETLPNAKEIWDGHFVAQKTEADDIRATLLLMSLEEWEKTSTEALTVPDDYTENGITGWRIPTETEMKNIITSLGYTIDDCNSTITENDGVALTSSGNYLCEDATKTITFYPSSTLNAFPVGTSTYKLRLVKTINVVVKQTETQP